jgi:uncharacterized protein YidB (DUF937 family)
MPPVKVARAVPWRPSACSENTRPKALPVFTHVVPKRTWYGKLRARGRRHRPDRGIFEQRRTAATRGDRKMGLLDQIAGAIGGAVGGTSGGGDNPLLQMVMQFIRQQPGGLQGLVESLTKGGLGEQVASWVGQGQNLPVSGGQIAAALQGGGIGDLLKGFGLDSPESMDGLAKMLPDVVNQLTPNGRVEAETPGGLESQLGGLLGKLTG